MAAPSMIHTTPEPAQEAGGQQTLCLPQFVSPFTEPRFWKGGDECLTLHHEASNTTLYLSKRIVQHHCSNLSLDGIIACLSSSKLPIQAIVDWCHVMHYLLVPKPIRASGECLWTRQVLFLIHLCWVNDALGIGASSIVVQLVTLLMDERVIDMGRPKNDVVLMRLIQYLQLYREDVETLTILDLVVYACVTSVRPTKHYNMMPLKLRIALQNSKDNHDIWNPYSVTQTNVATYMRSIAHLAKAHSKLYDEIVANAKKPFWGDIARSVILDYIESCKALPSIPMLEELESVNTRIMCPYIRVMHNHDQTLPSFRATHIALSADTSIQKFDAAPNLPTAKLFSGDGLNLVIYPWILYYAWPLYANYWDGGFDSIVNHEALEFSVLPAISLLAIVSMCYGSNAMLESCFDDMTHAQRVQISSLAQQMHIPTHNPSTHVAKHAADYLQQMIK